MNNSLISLLSDKWCTKMAKETDEIGLRKFTDDELESITLTVEEQLLDYIRKSKHWEIIMDYQIILSLSQKEDNSIDFAFELELASNLEQASKTLFHEELTNLAEKYLKEVLQCQKNSNK